MKSNFGTNLNYTLFGESHGKAVGISIQGLKAGLSFNFDEIKRSLYLRNGGMIFNTPRQEEPNFEIISGYFNGKTTGTPLTVLFHNLNTKSHDYSHLLNIPRPGHADFVAGHKYSDAQDYRGGGHFSGRLSTPLIFLGSICQQLLNIDFLDFKIYSHISSFQGLKDFSYYEIRRKIVESVFKKHGVDNNFEASDILSLNYDLFIKDLKNSLNDFNLILKNMNEKLPVIDNSLEEKITELAVLNKKNLDSCGGEIESIIVSPPEFIGDPFFHSFESVISSLIYSIPSTKSVSFGYDFKDVLGSQVKDEIIAISPKLMTLYNYNGGINGGITNGEDVVLKTVIKPIASINKSQVTFDKSLNKLVSLNVNGRHDSTIINRVIPVIDAVLYIAIYDMYLGLKK